MKAKDSSASSWSYGITLSTDPSVVLNPLNDQEGSGLRSNWLWPYLKLDSKIVVEAYLDFQIALRGAADEWINSHRQLWFAPNVSRVLRAFVGEFPLEVQNHIIQTGGDTQTPSRLSPVLDFRGVALAAGQTVTRHDLLKRTRFELGYRVMAMVCSDWSGRFFRCPEERCGRYFVNKNPQAARPRCTKKCRRRYKLNETKKKERQRRRQHIQKLEAGRTAYEKVSPKSSWDGRATRANADAIAREANKSLPDNLKITWLFVVRQERGSYGVGVSNYDYIWRGAAIRAKNRAPSKKGGL